MKEKLIYGFGDSLVQGHYLGIGMLDALADKHGMIYRKYARNGAKILPTSPLLDERDCPIPDVAAQIEAADDEIPDFICFDGLTNDAHPHTIVGNLGGISASYNGIYDNTTFYGAFERVCFLLREKYRDSRILYICVHKMPTRDMVIQKTLQKAAREVCEKWSIPYVDIFRQGQINTCVEGMRRQYSYNTMDSLTDGNGTHLNAEGYEKWYLPMIENALTPYGLGGTF